ncbi:MAG: hypothetical protein EP343_05585 [Deltaproteobacteria bacterium]|nr:MAG: hypothetical protein EP343_05585 [Deltaproteobacteria bacterium]
MPVQSLIETWFPELKPSETLTVKHQHPIRWSEILKQPSLQALTLSSCHVDTLAPLEEEPSLTTLTLDKCKVSVEVLSSAPVCPHIKSLTIEGSPLLADAWDEWLRVFPNLTSLSLTPTHLDWELLPKLEQHPTLEHVGLRGWRLPDRDITPDRIEWLASLSQLCSVRLSDLRLKQTCFAMLCSLSLRGLHVKDCMFHVDELQHLPQLSILETLELEADWDLERELSEDDTFWELEELPKLPKLRTLILVGKLFRPEKLSLLASCPQLTSLTLFASDIRDESVEVLQSIRTLEALTLDETYLTDLALVALSSFKNLKALGLPHTRITSEHLDELLSLPQLEALNVSDTYTDGPGLWELLKHPSLRHLVCDFSAIESGVCFRFLREWLQHPERTCTFQGELLTERLPSSLELNDATITPDLLACLLEWEGLASLTWYDTEWEDAEAPSFHDVVTSHQNPALQELTCKETDIPDVVLQHLSMFPNLRKLVMEELSLPESDLSFLGSLQNLETFDGYALSFDPGSLFRLTPLPLLKELHLVGPPTYIEQSPSIVWTADSLSTFTSWPALEHLSLSNSILEQGCFSVLATFPLLHGLCMKSCLIPGQEWPLIRELSSLESLNLGSVSIPEGGMEAIASLPRLRKLELSSATVLEGSLAALAFCTQLEHLDCFGCSVTEEDIQQLSGLHRLKYLDLSWSAIHDGIADVFLNFPELEYLGLAGVQELSGIGFEHIVKCKPLETINLAKAWIGGEAMVLLGSLPRLFTVYFYHGHSVSDAESYRTFERMAPYCSVIW